MEQNRKEKSNKKSKITVIAIVLLVILVGVGLGASIVPAIKKDHQEQMIENIVKKNAAEEKKAENSEKEEMVLVPDFQGMDQSEMEKQAKKAGLKISIKSQYSEDIEKGFVIQQELEPKEKVAENTKIVVTISKGEEQIEVPNLLGMEKKVALEKLKKLGISYELEEGYSSSVAKGKVSAQSYKNQKIGKSTKISLTISKGSKSKTKKKKTTTKKKAVKKQNTTKTSSTSKIQTNTTESTTSSTKSESSSTKTGSTKTENHASKTEKTDKNKKKVQSDMSLDDLDDVQSGSDFSMDDLDNVQ